MVHAVLTNYIIHLNISYSGKYLLTTLSNQNKLSSYHTPNHVSNGTILASLHNPHFQFTSFIPTISLCMKIMKTFQETIILVIWNDNTLCMQKKNNFTLDVRLHLSNLVLLLKAYIRPGCISIHWKHENTNPTKITLQKQSTIQLQGINTICRRLSIQLNSFTNKAKQ